LIFDRVLGLLDADALKKCVMNWTAELVKGGKGKLVAIDGKRCAAALPGEGRKCPSIDPLVAENLSVDQIARPFASPFPIIRCVGTTKLMNMCVSIIGGLG
jgi:hypothetical protein